MAGGTGGGGHSSGGSHVGATKKGGPGVPGSNATGSAPTQPRSSAQIGVIRQNQPIPATVLGRKGGRIVQPYVRYSGGPRLTSEH